MSDLLPLLTITAVAAVLSLGASLFVLLSRKQSQHTPHKENTQHLSVEPHFDELHDALYQFTKKTELQQHVVNTLIDRFEAHAVAFYIYNSASQEMIDPIVRGYSDNTPSETVRSGIGTVGTILHDRRPFYVPSISRDPRFGTTTSESASAYLVPLLSDGKLIGLIRIESFDEDGFSPDHRNTLNQYCEQVAKALQLASRIEAMQQTIESFSQFQALSRHLVENLETKELLQEIVDTARAVLSTEMSILMLLDKTEQVLLPSAWAGIEDHVANTLAVSMGEDIKGLVARARLPARTPDLRTDQRSTLASHAKIAGMRSELAVPVIYRTQLFGVLAVETAHYRQFTDGDMELLNALASQAGVALRNSELFASVRQTNAELEKAVTTLDVLRRQAEYAMEQAMEANRLKTQFLSSMSHELRTPLNAIMNFTQIVSNQHAGPLNEKQVSFLGHVYDSSRHLLELINDILDLAKIDAGKAELHLESVDLNRIIRGIMSIAVGLTKDKGLKLYHEVDENIPTLMIDERRIRQVMLNIMSNAAKFTEKGSISLHAIIVDQYVQISVTDTGIGIPVDKIDAVFEEFRQLDGNLNRQQQGTGLGMALSKKLVEMHGGRIWIDSTVGIGTTVYFTLPLQANMITISERAS